MLDRAYVAAYFGVAYVAIWVGKRIRGDKSPVVVFPVVRSGGPRGW
jgi:hypothetical protein